MNLLAQHSPVRDAPSAGRESAITQHIIMERMAVTIYRTALLDAARRIEREMSRMQWIPDCDKADVIAQLREWAAVTDEQVERAAEDEAAGFVNEGVF